MSSKGSKGSSDSLPTKTKKDKTKKESKKEKKEKSKKRHSKDLDKDADVDVEIEGDQDGSSPKTKKTFGMFRLGSGRKSKSDKRGSKHGSSDDLKNSSESERRGSEFSLEDSTASSEVSTTTTEVSATSSKVSTTSTEVPATKIANPQSGIKASNESESEKASLVVETSSEVKIVSTVHTDLAEDKDISKPGTKEAGEDHSSPKEDVVSEQLAKETLKEEFVSLQEQAPVASQTNEFKLQSSVILSEANKNAEGNEEQNLRVEDSKKESVQLVIEENLSTYEKKDQVEVPESGRNYEVSLEDIKTEQDREITSSEDDSVDTVISTGIQNTGAVIAETTEETEIEIQSKFDVEEPILSTHHERKGPLQDAAQEQPPIDEDAIVLVYENKTQDEIREEQPVQEVPIMIATKEIRQDVFQSEITVQEEPLTETEPMLLIENEVKKDVQIHTEAQAEGPSEEELLMPTYVERKAENNIEEEQEEQEAQVNVEAVVLSYPDKEEDQVQDESQDGPVADKEDPVVLEITQKKDNQFQEQVDEFLKLDANNKERSTQKRAETAKKGEQVEPHSREENELPKTKEIIDERSEKFRREPSPFGEKTTFITSTPKSESADRKQVKRKDEGHMASQAVMSYDITRSKGISAVEFQLKVQFVNNIKDVKMCTKALLAQLAEINKKLRTLQKELVEIQKHDSDKEPEIVNTEDA